MTDRIDMDGKLWVGDQGAEEAVSMMVGVDVTNLRVRFVCNQHKRYLLTEDARSSRHDTLAAFIEAEPSDSPNWQFDLSYMYCPENDVDNDTDSDCADFYGVVITNDVQDWREPEDIA
jgi:hypothetical protein